MTFLSYNNYNFIINIYIIIYQFIYKTGGSSSNSTYIIMTHESRMKIYTYKTKHEFVRKCLRYNLQFLLNNIPTIVIEKLNTHTAYRDLLSTLRLFFSKISLILICKVAPRLRLPKSKRSLLTLFTLIYTMFTYNRVHLYYVKL